MSKMENFADRLLDAIEKKQNPSVVGLDPRLGQIPSFIKEEQIGKFGKTFEAAAASILAFNKKLIDSIKDIAPAVKPQMAFYENYGSAGVDAFQKTVEYARQNGLIVIEDAKRSDIGSTAEAYAKGHLGRVELFGEEVPNHDVDCITVNAFLGSDGVKPFIEAVKKYGKGIFVLAKTSNPSSGEIQDLKVGEKTIYEAMAELVNKWGEGTEGSRGYSPVGAVVGATYPEQAVTLRKIMPKSIFLVPGYGAQGGGAADTVPCFNKDGFGAIVNSSRGIIFAYQKGGKFGEDKFELASGEAAVEMKDSITKALKEAGICAW